MILYLDTSALVKMFTDEPESDLVRKAAARAEFRGCHIVGYAEACAALSRQGRAVGLTRSEIQERIAHLTLSWADIDVVQADWPLVHRAGQLAVDFGLRGFDSVHLAAAEALWRQVGGEAEFRIAVFDKPLAAAARTLGMQVLDR